MKEIKFSTYPGWPKEAVFGVSKEKTKRGRRRDASLVENDSHGVFGDVAVQSGDSRGVFGEDVPIETPRAVRAVPAAPTRCRPSSLCGWMSCPRWTPCVSAPRAGVRAVRHIPVGH